MGGKSLAKYTDGLWHPAIIRYDGMVRNSWNYLRVVIEWSSLSYSTVGELFTVHFSTLNATAQLEPDCVLPLGQSCD